MTAPFEYDASIKSRISDEWINIHVLRPLAGLLVRLLYYTPVTPNQVTLASMVAGFVAAMFYANGTSADVMVAGLFVTLKDLLDSADGQLARAKNRYSRRGRFLDSIGDFLVNAVIFASIGWVLSGQGEDLLVLFPALLALAGITLRVSYHVFYQVSFLHLEGAYAKNRITEEITDEDLRGDRLTLLLQKMFLLIYGWQDRLMMRIDEWCRRRHSDERFLRRWYSDAPSLRLSGFLGLGTELFLLTVCSLLNALGLYLLLNIILMNGVLLACIGYRRWVLQRTLIADASSSSAGSA